MSWMFSRALVEAYENSRSSLERVGESSAATCSDGEPCAQLNVMPTAQPFWHRGKPMESSRHSLSGQTLKPLTASHGEELLTWFREAFRVPTSAQPVKAQESTESIPAYGGKWPASLAKYDQATSSWKTAQRLLDGGLDEFSGTWPDWGSMRNGECWERDMSGLPTSATGPGSLPTPSGVRSERSHAGGTLGEWGGSSNPWRGTEIGAMSCADFEEWVMGWPERWTVLTPYETARFRSWQQQFGNF